MLDTTFNMLLRTFISHTIWDKDTNAFSNKAYNGALIELLNQHFVSDFKEISYPKHQCSGGFIIDVNPTFKKKLIQKPIKVTINSFIYYLITNMDLNTNFPIKDMVKLVHEFRIECKRKMRENQVYPLLDECQINAKAFLNATHGMFYNGDSLFQSDGCYTTAIRAVSNKIWNALRFLYDDENVFYIDSDTCYINSDDESLVKQWAEKLKLSIEIERPDFVVINAKKMVTELSLPLGIPFTLKINNYPYSVSYVEL